MKNGKFQMRISAETKAMLNELSKHYNLSASAVIDMLIAEKFRSVNCQSTADVQEVKHGKWIFDSECGITKCSACNWSIEEFFTDYQNNKQYKYCPVCGARMDGGNK